jgi:hypothetical protein
MCFFICFILVLYLLIISCLRFVFCSLIFVKLVFRIIVLHSKCIASHGKFTSCFMSNDPNKFIIPIFISKYLKLKSKGVRTVRGRGPDRLEVPGGPSASTPRTVREGHRGAGRYWMFWSKFQTAEVPNHPQVHRGLSVRVAHRWDWGREQ